MLHTRSIRRFARAAAVGAVVGGVRLAGAQQSQSTGVTGRVTDAATGQPVGSAQIFVVGTTIGQLTGPDGRYTLRGVPAGTQTVRVLRVGFSEQKRTVSVAAGQTATLNFALQQVSVELAPVVTTATGEQRRVELGNAVSTIDVAKRVGETPIKNMGDLLVAKAPGVQVLPANMTGGGARVRIRGTSSLSLSNDPIYIIDGIRMTSNSASSAIGVGGTSPNRVNDINPEEIENIEIVKGPSAATLYGTDAANGVIVITTKRGRAGATRWTTFGEAGLVQDKNSYDAQYAIFGHSPGSTTARRCFLKDLSAGTCLKDSTSTFSVLTDPELTPIKDGHRVNGGIQLSGGSEAVRYFASGDLQQETGPFGLPNFERQRFDSAGILIPDEWDRPNALRKGTFRANINATVNPKLDLAVQSGFIKVDQRLPQVDNNVNSFWFNALTGPGFRARGPGYTGVGSNGRALNGYARFTPGDIFQETVKQNVQRFIGSTNANWRPFSWMQNRADVGLDLTDRVDQRLCRFGQCADFGTQRQGFADDARANIRNITTNLSSTAAWQVMPSLNLKTTAGAQYVYYRFDQARASGSQLPPGAQTPDAGTIPSVGSSTDVRKTLGLFVEEQAAIRDRLFLTGAVRSDQNSAFGTNFQRVYYPKASLSWIVSEERFFPRPEWLSELRVRSSVGSSGVQPLPTDALRTFGVVTTSVAGTDVSGLRSAAIGNVNIKPERATEFEGGLDIRLFNSRVNLEGTYYSKTSHDALINQTIAPSAGTSVSTVKSNLGTVKNAGLEGLLNAQLVNSRLFSWDLTVNGSHNTNKLVTLGTDAAGKEIPPIIGSTIREVPGYPLYGYWQRPFTYADANNDGIITPNEVTVDTAFAFVGYSQPRNELSISNGIELFNHRVRLNGLVDYKGGYVVLNQSRQFLCQQSDSCRELSDPTVSLFRQARAIANRFTPITTQYGYMEQVHFWRIREVAATLNLGDEAAQRFLRARGANLVFGVRNLRVFTNYTGVDPEANYSQGDTQVEFLTAGPQRYYTVRLNLTF